MTFAARKGKMGWALPGSVNVLIPRGAPPPRSARSLYRIYLAAPAGPALRLVQTGGEKPGKTPARASFTQGRAAGAILLSISCFFVFVARL